MIIALPFLLGALIVGMSLWVAAFFIDLLFGWLGNIPLVGGYISDGLEAIENAIERAVRGALGMVESALDSFLDGLADIWNSVWKGITSAVDAVAGAVEWLWTDGIPQLVRFLIRGVELIANEAWSAARAAARFAEQQAAKFASWAADFSGWLLRELLVPFKDLERFVLGEVWPFIRVLGQDIERFFTEELPALLVRLGDLERKVFGEAMQRIGALEQDLYDLIKGNKLLSLLEMLMPWFWAPAILAVLRALFRLIGDLWALMTGDPKPLLRDTIRDVDSVARELAALVNDVMIPLFKGK